MMYSCQDSVIDHSKSNINSTMDLVASNAFIELDETMPEETALTMKWTSAGNKGSSYIIDYKYEISLVGGDASSSRLEYIDDFEVKYTNAELQNLLISWGVPTDTECKIQTKITATYDGPTLVIPEEATSVISIRTYGMPQFAANDVFMSGSAVGDKDIKMVKESSRFTFTGILCIGSLNFPVNYANDEKLNAISPKNTNYEVLEDVTSEAIMLRTADAYNWNITEEKTYRITVDIIAKTVSITDVANILEIDSLFIGGTSIVENTKIEMTLEDNAVYAWKGELSEGSLYLPIYFNGMMLMSILPVDAGSVELTDGRAMAFVAGEETSGNSNYWIIPKKDEYRVVVNTSSRTVTIYSAEKDLPNYEVVYAKTFPETINPYTQKLTKLWMLHKDATGGNIATDGEHKDPGFNTDRILKQSLANPSVFVYSGDAISGGFKFCSDNFANNVFAFGYSDQANNTATLTEISADVITNIYGGQGNNRYSYIGIPSGTNYIEIRVTGEDVANNGRTILYATIVCKTK